MPLYSLEPSFRPLLAPVPRLRLRTDTHTQDNYRNPPAHARRGLIVITMVPWERGKLMVWDVTCSDTFASSYAAAASREPGEVAALAKERKVAK